MAPDPEWHLLHAPAQPCFRADLGDGRSIRIYAAIDHEAHETKLQFLDIRHRPSGFRDIDHAAEVVLFRGVLNGALGDSVKPGAPVVRHAELARLVEGLRAAAAVSEDWGFEVDVPSLLAEAAPERSMTATA